MRASMTPTRSRSGAAKRPTIAFSGPTTAARTWPWRTSVGGSVARSRTCSAVIGRPCRMPPFTARVLLGRSLRERVLHDREAGAVPQELGAHSVDLAHREPAVVGEDERVGAAQALGELRHDLLLVLSQHRSPPSNVVPAFRAGTRGDDSSRPPRRGLRAGARSIPP